MSEHELWNELGNLYFMSGAFNQAIYAYNRSIKLDTTFGRPYSNLALTYVQQGKYEEAIELYRYSIELLADNKEKAISWSRLGNVYRHLKDYSKAVVAYQQADELDPQSILEDKPQNVEENPSLETREMPQSAADASAQYVDAAPPQPEAIAEETLAPELGQPASFEIQSVEQEELTSTNAENETEQILAIEDIPVGTAAILNAEAEISLNPPGPEEMPVISVAEIMPAKEPDPEPDLIDESTASWALADLTRYQEDISEPLEPGSLTIWGEPDSGEDDDWDLYPPLEPDSDVYQPDEDEEDLDKWIPIPEEEPHSELEALELFKQLKNEMLEPDVKPSELDRVTESATYLQTSEDGMEDSSNEVTQQGFVLIPEQSSTDVTEQSSTVYPLAVAVRNSIQSQPKFHRIELEVEERTQGENRSQIMNDFVVVEEAEEKIEEIQTLPNQPDPEVQPLVRDPQEMEEINAGIAKFKRAVQVNPRNAYAWDALGTLYKSAGNYSEAILAYQQATSIDPPKALYYHNLGLVYACQGRDEDAIGAFEKVVEIDPDYSLAHATLGGYYRKKGMEELAQKHIGKAMKNIFDSENEYNRACLEAICGNADHAIELLGVALKNKQTYVDWILRDPDLDFIRQDPRFKQLVSDYTR